IGADQPLPIVAFRDGAEGRAGPVICHSPIIGHPGARAQRGNPVPKNTDVGGRAQMLVRVSRRRCSWVPGSACGRPGMTTRGDYAGTGMARWLYMRFRIAARSASVSEFGSGGRSAPTAMPRLTPGRSESSSNQRLKYLNSSMSWPWAFQLTVQG